jgi:hypothetical protein
MPALHTRCPPRSPEEQETVDGRWLFEIRASMKGEPLYAGEQIPAPGCCTREQRSDAMPCCATLCICDKLDDLLVSISGPASKTLRVFCPFVAAMGLYCTSFPHSYAQSRKRHVDYSNTHDGEMLHQGANRRLAGPGGRLCDVRRHRSVEGRGKEWGRAASQGRYFGPAADLVGPQVPPAHTSAPRAADWLRDIPELHR